MSPTHEYLAIIRGCICRVRVFPAVKTRAISLTSRRYQKYNSGTIFLARGEDRQMSCIETLRCATKEQCDG